MQGAPLSSHISFCFVAIPRPTQVTNAAVQLLTLSLSTRTNNTNTCQQLTLYWHS